MSHQEILPTRLAFDDEKTKAVVITNVDTGPGKVTFNEKGEIVSFIVLNPPFPDGDDLTGCLAASYEL